MKIVLRTLSALLVCVLIFSVCPRAQSFILKDANNNIVSNNDTIVVAGDTSQNMFTGLVKVMNISNFGRFVFAERFALSVVPGTMSAFAWAWLMFTPSVSISPDGDSIHPGQTDSTFAAWYFPMGIPGTSWYRYCFFDQSNHSDSVCVVFEYRVAAVAGIENINENKISVFPNPSNGIFTLSFQHSLSEDLNITLYDAFGNSIFQMNISSNSMNASIDLLSQPNGIYFVKLIGRKNDFYQWKKIIKD